MFFYLNPKYKKKKNFTDEITVPIVEPVLTEKNEDLFKSPLDFIKTDKFKLIANHNNKIFFWEPESIEDYFPLGHITTTNPEKPKKSAFLIKSSMKPDDYMPVGMCNKSHLIWRPIPHSLGYVVSQEKPSVNKIRIIDPSYLTKTTLSDMFFDSGDIGSSQGIKLWNIEDSDYFFAKSKDKNDDIIHPLYSIPKQLTIPHKKLKITYTDKYDKIWENKSKTSLVSVWRPKQM